MYKDQTGEFHSGSKGKSITDLVENENIEEEEIMDDKNQLGDNQNSIYNQTLMEAENDYQNDESIDPFLNLIRRIVRSFKRKKPKNRSLNNCRKIERSMSNKNGKTGSGFKRKKNKDINVDNCRKRDRTFKNKKRNRKTERWLPQLKIEVEKVITIDFKRRQISLNIEFIGNTNTFTNATIAQRVTRRIAKILIETGYTISISGSTIGNLRSSMNEAPYHFYTINGQRVPASANLPALVNGRANALMRLLIQAGVPPNQIVLGAPIYDSTRRRPLAAIGTITSDKVIRKVRHKVKWNIHMKPVGIGKHSFINKTLDTKTIDNR
jgi:hypothetical protein